MSLEPLKRCVECGRRGPWSRCPACARVSDHRRGSARARGYDARWDRYSRSYLARNLRCGDRDGYPRTGHSVCSSTQMVPNPSTVTDHVRPHNGEYALLWDPANHQALCTACHQRKTMTIDRARPVS